MPRLRPPAARCIRSTGRVRLQVVEVGQRADSRHAAMTKQIEELPELVKGLANDSSSGASKGGGGAAGSAGAGSSQDGAFPGAASNSESAGASGAGGGANADVSDRAVLRTNTHEDVGRSHVHAQFAAFLAAHTSVPITACKVRPAAGRSFTLRFSGTQAVATRHADEAFQELRDTAGQWRQLHVALGSGGTTRLYVGRDRSLAQVVRGTTGKKSAQVMKAGSGDADVYFRKTKRGGASQPPPLGQGACEQCGRSGGPLEQERSRGGELGQGAFPGRLGGTLPQGTAEHEWSR